MAVYFFFRNESTIIYGEREKERKSKVAEMDVAQLVRLPNGDQVVTINLSKIDLIDLSSNMNLWGRYSQNSCVHVANLMGFLPFELTNEWYYSGTISKFIVFLDDILICSLHLEEHENMFALPYKHCAINTALLRC